MDDMMPPSSSRNVYEPHNIPFMMAGAVYMQGFDGILYFLVLKARHVNAYIRSKVIVKK